MSTSIGQIQLDLEVKSDLDSDVQDTGSKIAKQLRESMKSYSNDLFKELRSGLENSLDSIQKTIENCLDKTKSDMQSFVDSMKNLVKGTKLEIPVVNSENPINPMQNISQKANAIRGPPQAKVKTTSVDLSQNSDVIKAQIKDTINQMSVLTGTIKSQEKELDILAKKYQETLTNINTKVVLENQIEKIGSKIEGIVKSMTDIENSIPGKSADEQTKLGLELDNLQKRYEKLNERIERYNGLLKEMNSEKLESQLESIEQKMLKIRSNISSSQLKSVSLGEVKNELEKKIQPDIEVSGFKSKIESLKQGVREFVDEVKRSHPHISKMGSIAGSTFSKIGSSVKNVATKGFQTLRSKLDQFMNNIKKSKKANDGFGGSFKRIFKAMSLFTIGLYAIRSGMRSLTSYVSTTLKTNKQFTNSLNEIKSNLQTAFTPIYQAMLPAINSLMSALARATAYISAFISTIFGKSLSASKQATSSLNEARDSISGVGSSAKDTAKQLKEANRYLLSFDEINNRNTKDDSSSGGGSGSIYTPSDIDTSAISEFAQKLRDLWKK